MTPSQRDYSGKLNLRMSSSLHAHLVTGAAREGVSLNAWIIALLAGASGFKNEGQSLRNALRQIVRNNDPKQGGMFCNFCEAAEIAEKALKEGGLNDRR